MTKEFKRECERCKTEFEAFNEDITWCSEECKRSFHLNHCKRCDKEFYSYAKRVHCSDKCRTNRCIVCSKLFVSTYGHEKCCSDKCKVKRYTHTCKGCGESFYRAVTKATYCSRACQYITSRNTKYRVCKNCRTPILVVSSNFYDYCNRNCYDEYQKNVKKKKRIDKKMLEDLSAIVKDRVYSLIDRMLSEDVLHNYGSLSLVNANGFTQQLKDRVKERDGYCCYICENNEGLEVHHIVKQRMGGTHTEDNLVTLCKRCHRHIETGDRDYALKKCLENAKKTYGHISFQMEEEVSNKIRLGGARTDLELAISKLSENPNEENREIVQIIDIAIDEIEKVQNKIKK